MPAETAVLVVGAGPTGLLLASELYRRGVACEVIDAHPALLHWDRATVLHPRSLQVFEALGLIEGFLDAGVKQRGARMYSDGRLLGELDLATCGSRYRFNIGLSEEVTESILTDYLVSQGGAVHRSSRLVALEPGSGGVMAGIETDGARHDVLARWIVGCDGIHSPTRELSRIGFEGHDIPDPWAVFDAALQDWPDAFDLNFGYLDEVPVILTALPDRRWRVYLRPSSPDSDLVTDASSTIGRYQPASPFVEVENPTRFHCHTKVAERFRSGRVLLAGDAAHLCSPAEGHGMNSGLQDAFNFAWKLALVSRGVAGPDLLDSYEAERRPVAQMITRSGEASEHAQTLTDPAERRARNRALEDMFADPNARHHEAIAEAELNVDYTNSPIVVGDANARVRPGQRLPDNIAVQTRDLDARLLHELTHRSGHTLLLVNARPTDGEFERLLAAVRRASIDSAVVEAVFALHTNPHLEEQMGSIDPAATDLLGIDGTTLLAVRPDGFVGLRTDRDHLSALEAYEALIRADGKSE